MGVFKLGRLEYCLVDYYSFPTIDVKPGDTTVEVHIPADGPLDESACRESFDLARAFFKKHFPEREFKAFGCHSWLLNEEFEEILGENSNIVKFKRLFTITEQRESDSLFRYIFNWESNRETIPLLETTSRFAGIIKELVIKGHIFHNGVGYIER